MPTSSDLDIIETILKKSSIAELIKEHTAKYVKTNALRTKCSSMLHKLSQPELPHFIGLPNFKHLFSDTESELYRTIMLPLLEEHKAKVRQALIECKRQAANIANNTLEVYEVTIFEEANERLNNLIQDEITKDFINKHKSFITNCIVKRILDNSKKIIFAKATANEKHQQRIKKHEEKMDVAEAEVNADPSKTFRDIAKQVALQVFQQQGKHHPKV